MKPNSVLIVGCGDLGLRCGSLLEAVGYGLAGVRRDVSSLPASFTRYAADYSQGGSLNFLEAAQPAYLVATFVPLAFSAQGYHAGFVAAAQNVLQGLGSHRPRRIFMVSSTRVYAEREGGWVEESSALAQQGFAAQAIIAAEQLFGESGHRLTVLRFGGIYGDTEGRLLNRVRGGDLCAAQPVRYSNRIHRDDCAGLLAYLIQRDAAGTGLERVYLGVDDEPAPQIEVEQWLAQEIGVANPVSTAVSPSTGHKRCRNLLLHASGYRLRYPNYRSGYREVLGKCAKQPV